CVPRPDAHSHLRRFCHILRSILSLPSFFSSTRRPPPTSTLFPYTTLFRSCPSACPRSGRPGHARGRGSSWPRPRASLRGTDRARSEEHTSELQSRFDLVCRLLLEKKKIRTKESDISPMWSLHDLRPSRLVD